MKMEKKKKISLLTSGLISLNFVMNACLNQSTTNSEPMTRPAAGINFHMYSTTSNVHKKI